MTAAILALATGIALVFTLPLDPSPFTLVAFWTVEVLLLCFALAAFCHAWATTNERNHQ